MKNVMYNQKLVDPVGSGELSFSIDDNGEYLYLFTRISIGDFDAFGELSEEELESLINYLMAAKKFIERKNSQDDDTTTT